MNLTIILYFILNPYFSSGILCFLSGIRFLSRHKVFLLLISSCRGSSRIKKGGFRTDRKNEPLLSIKIIDSKNSQDLNDAFYIRREVFIKEQNVPEEEEFDEADSKSHHVILYSNSAPVATGRLCKDGDNWLVGRISVLKEFRGKHAGKLLVEKLLEKAVELGAEEVHIHAQTHAVSFYEKFGFTTYGEVFFEAGIEHISMVKKF